MTTLSPAVSAKTNAASRSRVTSPYSPVLSVHETQLALQHLKHEFSRLLASKLNLLPVVAPRFVAADSGLQDGLDGVMQPVTFAARAMPKRPLQVVQSLAKWKRQALQSYELPVHRGVLTDMMAIRKDDEIDSTHSLLVDQWDWEQKIAPADRSADYLQATVLKIYEALLELQASLCIAFPKLTPLLPQQIHFLHAQQLADRWPELSPASREQKAVEEYGAVFVRGIGGKLKEGRPHGVRSWDYDDYTTVAADGLQGLNGDIVVLNPTSGRALELSSMGIRVDAEAMLQQAEAAGVVAEALNSPFHRAVLESRLPSCIGGGIGQSRVALLLLRKMHIGEVQCSVWPSEQVEEYRQLGARLLL